MLLLLLLLLVVVVEAAVPQLQIQLPILPSLCLLAPKKLQLPLPLQC